MIREITPRQRSILEFIADMVCQHGYPPSIQEIGERFGIASTNGVFDHLRALEKKGYIERSPKARSIRLTQLATAGLVRREAGTAPLVGRVAAGQPLLAEENVEGYVPISSRLGERDVFALRIVGDSMTEAGILEGDVIVVDRGRSPRPGNIVVALVEGEATVKYFFPFRDQVELRPANSRMRAMRFPATRISLLGVVVAMQRDLQ